MNPRKRVYVLVDEVGGTSGVENSARDAFLWPNSDVAVFTYELVGKTRRPAKKKAAGKR